MDSIVITFKYYNNVILITFIQNQHIPPKTSIHRTWSHLTSTSIPLSFHPKQGKQMEPYIYLRDLFLPIILGYWTLIFPIILLPTLWIAKKITEWIFKRVLIRFWKKLKTLSGSSQVFLAGSVGISLYFGVHGYHYLSTTLGWPWFPSIFAVAIIEWIFLQNVNAAAFSRMSQWASIPWLVLSILFSISLPLIDAWSEYHQLNQSVATIQGIPEPLYYRDTVLPGLRGQLSDAEEYIAPLVAEKKRRLAKGSEIFMYGKYDKLPYTGFQAASWIPGRRDRSAFQRVTALKEEILKFELSDRLAEVEYNQEIKIRDQKLTMATGDADYGLRTFILNVGLILFFAVSSFGFLWLMAILSQQ